MDTEFLDEFGNLVAANNRTMAMILSGWQCGLGPCGFVPSVQIPALLLDRFQGALGQFATKRSIHSRSKRKDACLGVGIIGIWYSVKDSSVGASAPLSRR